MSRTNGRARRTKSAGGRDDDPHHHLRRGARKRRVWFATAAALAVVSMSVVAIAGFVFTSSSTTDDNTLAESNIVSADRQAQRAGLSVDWVPPPEAPEPKFTYAWPTAGPITQGMTSEHPLGIDIDTDYGATIRAVRAGTVVTAGGDPCCSYGYHVIVEHEDGWRSLYAHLSDITVAVGDSVLQGDLMGFSGDTGKSTGTHLHFELQAGRTPVNPLNYLEPFRSYVVAEVETAGQTEADVESRPTGTAFTSSVSPDAALTSAASPDAGTQVADAAISTAIPWLEEKGEATYVLNSASCYAESAGPNWSVYCGVTNVDCSQSPDCPATVQACVFRSLDLVAARCSGY